MVLFPYAATRLFSLLIFSQGSYIERVFDGGAYGYIAFAHGVLGAVMAGWGLLSLFILAGPFRRGEKTAYYAILASVSFWALLDMLISFRLGFWQNGVLNIVVLALFILPMLVLFSVFRGSSATQSVD